MSDAISRPTDTHAKADELRPDPFLIKARRENDANKHRVLDPEQEFMPFIDRTIMEFTDELGRRY